jgi:hypothetical protein
LPLSSKVRNFWQALDRWRGLSAKTGQMSIMRDNIHANKTRPYLHLQISDCVCYVNDGFCSGVYICRNPMLEVTMTEFHTKNVLVVIGAVFTLLCAGCLDQEENITVAQNGNVTMEVKLSGEPKQLSDPVLIPSSPEWDIRERKIDSSGNSTSLTILAVANTPYGRSLPESFVAKGSPDYKVCLRFPSELMMESKGNRTFYTFRRTYEARRFSAFDLSEVPEAWDHELEKRVVDSGIMKVPEADRAKYLQQLRQGYNYQYWRFFREALADMVRSDAISDTVMDRLANEASTYLEKEINPELFLTIMQLEEKEVQTAIDSLALVIDRQFKTIVSGAVHNNGTKAEQFERAYSQVQREYEVTEKFNGTGYHVALAMPGTIISTNGVIDSREPGKVSWSFNGKKLRDADVPLYAVSVVTH